MNWKKEYLQLLRVKQKEPSTPYLKRLMLAHRHVFPFENIGKLIFQQSPLLEDSAHFLWQHKRYHTGGTCFTLNFQFSQLLEALGFECRFLMPGGDHMALLVKAPEMQKPLYVDVGTPAPIFTPLPLTNKNTQVPLFAGEKVILQPGETRGEYTYMRSIGGRIIDRKWAFSINERFSIADFEKPLRLSCQDNAPYMTHLRCERWCARKRRLLTLRNHELTVRYSSGGKMKREIKCRRELREVMTEVFKLPSLPVEQAELVLEERGYSMWAEREGLSG